MDGKLKGSPAESQQVGVESPVMKELPPVTQPPPAEPELNRSPLGAVGTLLIVFATLLVLHNLGLLPNPFVFAPLLLVYVGIRGIRHTEGPSRVVSIVFLTVGVMMQIGMFSNMNSTDFGLLAPLVSISRSLGGVANRLEDVFSLLLVAGGIYLIRRNHLRGVQRAAADADASGTGPASTSDIVNLIAIFSGAERRLATQRFSGGRVTTIFGGAELDLRECEMEVPEARLHMSCIFGGAVVRVPAHWDVVVETVPIFGGVSSRGSKQAAAARLASGEGPRGRLVLTGAAIFGGIDVKQS